MSKQFKVKHNYYEMTREVTISGEDFNDALLQYLQECIKTQDTGGFFDLDEEDIEHFSKNPHFYQVELDGVKYGLMIQEYYEFNPTFTINEIKEMLEKMIDDNADNYQYNTTEYANGYTDGIHDALVDVMIQLGIETDEGYIND